jgi:hypothetical protein
MNELGERAARDRLDRIAEQLEAGVAVDILAAGGERERLVDERHELRARERRVVVGGKPGHS